MYTNTSTLSTRSLRDQSRRRHLTPRPQSFNEHNLSVNERQYTIKLRRRRAQAARSFYDNNEDDEEENITSKWTIVRQRLPDILALSQTYRPTSVRAQLVLLIALMNKQTSELTTTESRHLKLNEYNNTIAHIVPSNVLIDISGRTQLICLKRIPSEQVIHVDVDNLSFAIPTRQFILAISRGNAHETAARYCPPAIGDMLIDLSKTKFVNDRLKYKRAQFKMRLGQILFLVVFISIIAMMLTLIIGATKTLFAFDSFNYTGPYIPASLYTSTGKDGSSP